MKRSSRNHFHTDSRERQGKDRATPEHCRRTVRAIRGKGGEKSYHKKSEKINWLGRGEGKRVKWTSQRLMGDRRGRKEEFLAVWSLSALTGLKCHKQPPLEPPPHTLCPWSMSSISAQVQAHCLV